MSEKLDQNAEINHQIRQALKEKLSVLEERMVNVFKNEASSKYRNLPTETLIQIVRPIVDQSIDWLEQDDNFIEARMTEVLETRLKAGFNLADFMSVNTLIQRELQNYCKELFADQPKLKRQCSTRLYAISTIVQRVELKDSSNK